MDGARKAQRIGSQLLFGLFVAALAALLLWAAYVLYGIDRGMEMYDLKKNTTRLASTLFFEKLTAIAQVTVATMGAAWVLLMFGGDRAKGIEGLSHWYFWLANTSFGASLLVYVLGYDFIVGRLFHHGVFDVDAPFITGIKDCQLALFLKGCADLAGTALTARARA